MLLIGGFALEHPIAADFALGWANVARLADRRITLSDALTASMAVRLGARVLTFDRDFAVLGANVVTQNPR